MANFNQIEAVKLVDLVTKGSVTVQALIAAADGVTPATTTTAGIVKQAADQPASVATTVAGLVTDFNTLLASLKTAGIMA